MHQMTLLKDGTPVVLREAIAADAAALIELELGVFTQSDNMVRQVEEFRAETSNEGQRQYLQYAYLSPTCLCLVAELNGRLVGILRFIGHQHQRMAHSGEFSMKVATAYQNQGIGRCLLDGLLLWAKANPSIEKIKLSVFASNAPALHLYQSLGFEEAGRHPQAIKLAPNRYDDVINMYLFV